MAAATTVRESGRFRATLGAFHVLLNNLRRAVPLEVILTKRAEGGNIFSIRMMACAMSSDPRAPSKAATTECRGTPCLLLVLLMLALVSGTQAQQKPAAVPPELE